MHRVSSLANARSNQDGSRNCDTYPHPMPLLAKVRLSDW